MELDILKQRLKKFPEANLIAHDEGLTSKIEYKGIIFSNKRYGPLWDLFKRYLEDKLTKKDVKFISFTEEIEKEIEPEVSIEESELYTIFRQNLTRRVKLTYTLYKDYTKDVAGFVTTVTATQVTIFDTYGAQRTIDFKDVLKYKFYREEKLT